MKVLVINCGSSSIKYQFFDFGTNEEQLIMKGQIELSCNDESRIEQKYYYGKSITFNKKLNGHEDGIRTIIELLLDSDVGPVRSLSEIDAIGHRVVHAGEFYSHSVLIDDTVVETLNLCNFMAPLHNPPSIRGIEICRELMPDTPMVAVFDTAFHQTMRPEAYLYAIPYEYYEKHMIRKYGFHGTSHKYMSIEAAEMLNIDVNDLKIITCHLGNGASVTAVKHGRSIDTSMGLTPLEGLVMGTRCGDLDPTVVTFIEEMEGLTEKEVNQILNTQSGVLGISGVSSDFRDLKEAMNRGDKRAELALNIFARKVRFYIGAYIAEMNGADAIVFTGGIGENDSFMRQLICKNMGNLGIKIDAQRNEVARGRKYLISTDDAQIKTIVIPANEELVIGRETHSIVEQQRSSPEDIKRLRIRHI